VVAATDDLFALTLLTDVGIDHLLRRLIAAGLTPVRALRLATYHAALRLRRTDLGLVAPGRRADLAVLDDLEQVHVTEVFHDGRLVARDGRLLDPVVEGPSDPPYDTMRLGPVERDHFRLRLPGLEDGRHRLRTVAGAVVTEWSEVEAEVRDGTVVVPHGHVLQVVIHRHDRAPAVPVAALLADYGTWTGAIATTVSHDTHNLVVFGTDPDEMALAANTVIATGGGIAVVRGREVLSSIALPIGGILSPLPAAEVADAQRRTQDAALAIGLHAPTVTQPLFQVLLSSLACLGGPHVTDIGLVDGSRAVLVDTMVVI
jgi:adenine deaminase